MSYGGTPGGQSPRLCAPDAGDVAKQRACRRLNVEDWIVPFLIFCGCHVPRNMDWELRQSLMVSNSFSQLACVDMLCVL